ncbi:MAG: cyclic nucleotide-binding domain-containing protein, partial [Chloroflexota bacterium]
SMPAAPLMLGVIGIANATIDIAGYSLLQRSLPTTHRASGLAMFEGIAEAGIGAGGLVAAPVLALLGISGAFVAFGGALVIAGLLLVIPLRSLRAGLAGRTVIVDRLQAVALLAPLPLAAIEALAADAVPVRLSAGDALMREGERGDRYLVITSGSADISIGGAQVRTVGPGDGVGEIALLRDVPRTATVIARGPVEALAIEGAAFLAAVTGHPGSLGVATRVVDGHLGDALPVVAAD